MFRIEYGINDDAITQMCFNICRKDRNESKFFCDCLGTYIKEGVAAAGAHSVTVYNDKDQVMMLAGVSKSPFKDASADHGVGWVLKTNKLKLRNKKERREVSELFAKLMKMLREETPYKIIGNAIHIEQTASLIWMDRMGFNISWDTPGTFFDKNNKPGVFLQFSKEI